MAPGAPPPPEGEGKGDGFNLLEMTACAAAALSRKLACTTDPALPPLAAETSVSSTSATKATMSFLPPVVPANAAASRQHAALYPSCHDDESPPPAVAARSFDASACANPVA